MFKFFEKRAKAGGKQQTSEALSQETSNLSPEEQDKLKQLSDAVKARTEEVTNTNKAALVEQFSEDGVTIDGDTWTKMYDAAWESDDPTTKDESFRSKVLAAIKKWNKINPDDRHAYLELSDVDFLSLTDETDFNDDDLSVMTAARLLAEKRPDDTRTYEKPEEEKPEEEEEKPEEEEEEPEKEEGKLEEQKQEKEKPEEEKPEDQKGPEDDQNQWGDPNKELPPVQALYPIPPIPPVPKPRPTDKGPIQKQPEPTPEEPKKTPEKPEDKEPEIIIPKFGIPPIPAFDPDIVTVIPERKPVPIPNLLKIKDVIPPVPEQKEKHKERKRKVIDFLKKVPVALLLLACLINPFAPKQEAGKVNIQAQSESIVQTVVPGQTTQVEHTLQIGDEGYSEKMMNDLKIGDSIYVPGGKTYQESSYGVAQHPGAANEDYGTVGEHPLSPAGYYTVNRADSFDMQNVEAGHQNYISEEDGNTGTVIRETVTEGVDNAMPIIHLNGENSSAVGGERGWVAMEDVKDAAIVEKDGSLRTYTEVENVTTPEHTETSTRTIETAGEASTEDNKLSFDVEGQPVSIDLYNPDGSTLQAGQTVLGSDGQSYEIVSVTETEGEQKMKLSLKNVLTDIAIVVTAVGLTVAQYSALSRRKES